MDSDLFSGCEGLNLVSLGWLQTIPGIAQLIGMLLSGYIIDRLARKREKLAGAFACIGFRFCYTSWLRQRVFIPLLCIKPLLC